MNKREFKNLTPVQRKCAKRQARKSQRRLSKKLLTEQIQDAQMGIHECGFCGRQVISEDGTEYDGIFFCNEQHAEKYRLYVVDYFEDDMLLDSDYHPDDDRGFYPDIDYDSDYDPDYWEDLDRLFDTHEQGFDPYTMEPVYIPRPIAKKRDARFKI